MNSNSTTARARGDDEETKKRSTSPANDLTLGNCWHLFTRYTSVVEPEDPIKVALKVIAHKGFRHLPVARRDRGREIVGIVSAQDLIDEFSGLADQSPSSVRAEGILECAVSAIMNDRPVTVRRNQTIFDAIEMMSAENVGALPIVVGETKQRKESGEGVDDEKEEVESRSLVGIITLRDIVSLMAAFAPFGVTVGEQMTRQVVTIREDDNVLSAIRLMSANRIRRLPVMSSAVEGRISGMVTNKMVLRLIESCLSYNGPSVGTRLACEQSVKSIMASPMPTIVDSNEDCGNAAYLMLETGTGGFAVADSRGLFGMITERDLVRGIYMRIGISFFSELMLSKLQTMYA